jgi:hypothetical protein
MERKVNNTTGNDPTKTLKIYHAEGVNDHTTSLYSKKGLTP